MSVSPPEILLTAAALAKRWSLSLDALQAMRRRGTGPAFVRIGPKRVRYRLAVIEAFEQSVQTRVEADAKTARQRAAMAKARKAKRRPVKRRAAR